MTEGSDIRMGLRSTLAIVARQAFRMMLPVSAKRLLLEIDDVFQRVLRADDRADQLQALAFREDQQRPPGKWPLERLLDGDELRRVAALDQRRGFLAADDADCRDRQQNLFADHLAQAGRGPADAHIGDLRNRIAFDLGKLADVRHSLHRFSQTEGRAGQKRTQRFVSQRLSDERGI